MTDAHADQPRRIDRRRALRAAGAAALGVTLSELATSEHTASAQTTGMSLILGQENESTASTTLLVLPPEGGGAAPEHGLDIQASESTYGVDVVASVYGVRAFGLLGGSFLGDNDFGAPLELIPRVGSGPPPDGNHYIGEMVVDEDGKLWLCDADGVGDDAGWDQLSHRGMRFLPSPHRAVARRSLSGGQILDVNLASVVPGFPSDAVGAFGNFTVMNPRNTGFATLYSGSGGPPTVSNISWVQTNGFIANAFTTAISGGTIRIYVSQATYVYLDIAGYVL